MPSVDVPYPSIGQNNPRELVYDLRSYAHPDVCKHMSLLPHNRFRPDETIWWICPGSDDPAYHYGKFIAKSAKPWSDLFLGICFEKGIGPSAKNAFSATPIGRSWTTQGKWIWDSFFRALMEGEFDPYAMRAQDAADGKAVIVIITAIMMNPPEPRERHGSAYDAMSNLPHQHIVYAFGDSKLSLIDNQTTGNSLIASPGDCQTLSALAEKIRSCAQVDWLWIAVELGFLLRCSTENKQEWYTETLWANACEPFVAWFR